MKRIINKYICGVVIAASVLTFTSCNDFLDRSPQGSLTENDSPEGGMEEGKVFSIYAQMRSYNITAGIPAFAIHCFRSEDSEKGSQASDGADQAVFFDDFNYTNNNGVVSAYWTHNYTIIYNCNTVITSIEEKTNPGELDLINLAEAKFFRAYCFFNLVRAFGDVPKIDFRVDDAAQANIPKSSALEIYQLIDEDLTIAEKYLPISWESKYIGRLTWGAARSLHARTYMMRNDWANMASAAKEVINSKVYNLNTPYDKVFTDEGENCGESIFELQCTSTAGKPADLAIGSQFCEVQGVRGSGEWNLGWGWHMGTKEMGLAFESGDPRKDATLLYFRKPGEEKTPENTNTPYGESPESSADGAYFNKKAYTNPSKRKQYTNGGFWVNIRLIRYTDVLLMAAEAENELGNTTDALNYLEQVRAHARGTNSSILPKVITTDQIELRKAIQHERRVELGLEFDRFYDLVRWGIAKDVLHAAGKTNYQDKHRYLPIPQVEIDKSNGVLIQNPDYNS
ncbi:RagB/SusD family nutrient uptake outer membrane protein [Dysgonomonas sp. Marseille-P4677]|uniref:RagB/SusD family nutrient uptake outer membrane protein n=1 Tax=Dysgonomonas sp. Marseille-P4677 TaxID=2364790 RepID=UPI0019114EF2|nr:RagB/SusD family nutrient uptake outer membrane protein [Dysgonomonas sp. Marseille-P4677]MBK5720258.1 RagB/SusD family nutrient uptake outer membrane protein [Dysgonomonas sp. Marseille-P4677]